MVGDSSVRRIPSCAGRFSRAVITHPHIHNRPANGTVTIEHAVNRVFTTVAPNPVLRTFVDGKEHPGLGFTDEGKDGGCIVEPNSANIHISSMLVAHSLFLVHTVQNETMAAGTALAIS